LGKHEGAGFTAGKQGINLGLISLLPTNFL
jgi:hypothetical protein